MNFFRKNRKRASHNRKDVDLIKELATVLREHGDKILSGQVSFSLNTSSLTCLNQGLAQISNEDSNITFDVTQTHNSKLAVLHDLQFLYDFIQKIFSLKLVHGNATLQGRVNIHKFRALKVLEIKKIPIHLVMGLQSLRPRLESITCSRSVQSLEGLFAKCGGDMAQEFTWSELRTVDLSYNGIENIDDSLKLVPYLEVLNLSHNNLKKAVNLEHATLLKHISLTFNCLYECPSFSSSSRATLVSLNLSYNNLESLKGVDELYALEDLDVSGNCLVGHSVLQSIMLLRSLKLLNLKENPMSYHKRHREFTIGYLHPDTSKSVFLLDGKALTKQEVVLVQKTKVYSISNLISNSEPRRIQDDQTFEDSFNIRVTPASHSLNQSLIDMENSVESSCSPATRRKGRKISKIVDAVIIDPSTLDSENVPTVEQQISNSEEHLEIKSRIRDAREKFGPDWLIASKKNLGVVPKSGPNDQKSCEVDKSAEASTQDEKLKADVEDGANANDKPKEGPPSREHTPNLYDHNGNANEEENLSEDDLIIDDGTFYIVHTEKDESGSSYILTLGKRYITEKDSLTGKVVDELDLHSLIRFDGAAEESSISLIFDYVKKSKRERKYFFEDESQLNDFSQRIQPFVTMRNLKALKNGALQCLKCSAQFFKNNALSIVKTVEKKVDDVHVMARGNHNGQEGCLMEVPACPNCESDMVVEMSSSMSDDVPKRKASTPLSSLMPKVSFVKTNASAAVDIYDDLAGKQTTNEARGMKVDKVFKDDAVIYAPHQAEKVEIEVEAEVYNPRLNDGHNASNNDDDVISKSNGKITRTDSDISILSNPSQSSITVLSSQTGENENTIYSALEKLNISADAAESGTTNSFSDSLSGSVCTQLETSVYEEGEIIDSTLNDTSHLQSSCIDANGNEHQNSSFVDSEVQTPHSPISNMFTDLDYRIKLHLSMTFFGKDEDFRAFINAGIINYQKQQEFKGMLLLSNNNVYIMKIVGEVNVNDPQSYLQKVDCRSMDHLKYITVLYGRQGMQLEFIVKGKPTIYVILIRDLDVCQDFMTSFSDIASEWSKEFNRDLPLISSASLDTSTRIAKQLLNQEGSAGENDFVTLFIMGYWSLKDEEILPASFIFTKESIYVTQENYEWPIPWSLSEVETTRKEQFTLISQQKIMNLTEIECDPSVCETEAKLHFLDENTMQESLWNVSMTSLSSMNSFISAIRIPWEELFGVELNMPNKTADA